MKNRKTLVGFIDELQSQGRYWFTRDEGIIGTGLPQKSFIAATNRLAKINRIALISRGFYIIIPLEYKNRGFLPSSWYIDPFMKHLKLEYYVGLLMAASLHGVAHQQPQIFQVVVEQQLRIKKSKSNITFLVKKERSLTPIEKFKVDTGYINISSKEATALDLVQYKHLCGYWNNVATILLELSDALDEKLLLQVAIHGEYEIPTIQRLGYLLEMIGKAEKADCLQEYVETNKPQIVFLTTGSDKSQAILNEKWRILVNDKIETDEL